jgi:hypothetical protein
MLILVLTLSHSVAKCQTPKAVLFVQKMVSQNFSESSQISCKKTNFNY